MIVTVTTDASFSNRYKVGTYAFWVTSNLGRVQQSGQLRDMMKDSSQAEMKCICNALFFISKDAALMAKAKKILINTDSMNAIHLFTQDEKAIQKYKLKKKSYKKIFIKYLAIKALFDGKEIFYSHIKAHKTTANPAAWVNDWCDREAKAQMNKKITQIEKKKSQKTKTHDKPHHRSADNKLHSRSATPTKQGASKQRNKHRIHAPAHHPVVPSDGAVCVDDIHKNKCSVASDVVSHHHPVALPDRMAPQPIDDTLHSAEGISHCHQNNPPGKITTQHCAPEYLRLLSTMKNSGCLGKYQNGEQWIKCIVYNNDQKPEFKKLGKVLVQPLDEHLKSAGKKILKNMKLITVIGFTD